MYKHRDCVIIMWIIWQRATAARSAAVARLILINYL